MHIYTQTSINSLGPNLLCYVVSCSAKSRNAHLSTEKLTTALAMNLLAVVEALAQLRGLESGSISDPAHLRLRCLRVRTARPVRASCPRVPEDVACSICTLALVILKKIVAGRWPVAKESFIPEKKKASGCT